MRHNKFNETYCHTPDEARRTIDDNEAGWHVYATEFTDPVPDSEVEWDRFATCEIRTNQEGDLVCFLEAPTMAQVKDMVAELKLKDSWA